MNFFSTNLLVHTLRGIVEEIEQVDPTNPALAQLKFTIEHKAAELVRSGSLDGERARSAGALHQPPALWWAGHKRSRYAAKLE
jgi:hypothetical protein